MKAFYTLFLITLSFSLSLQFYGRPFFAVNQNLPFDKKLEASPPTVSLLKKYDNHIKLSEKQLPQKLQNLLVPALQHDKAAVASAKISEIAQLILLSAGIGHQTIQKEHWEFNIMDGTGRLLVFRVKAQISNYDVHITGGITEIVQNIPKIVEIHVKCAKTGNRKYGLFGPKKNVCKDHWIERGLNRNEINMVQNALMVKVPTALKMLQ